MMDPERQLAVIKSLLKEALSRWIGIMMTSTKVHEGNFERAYEIAREAGINLSDEV